jgi:hypothetical protein
MAGVAALARFGPRTHDKQRVAGQRMHGCCRERRPPPQRAHGRKKDDENDEKLDPVHSLYAVDEGGGELDLLDSSEGEGEEEPHDEEGGDGPRGS